MLFAYKYSMAARGIAIIYKLGKEHKLSTNRTFALTTQYFTKDIISINKNFNSNKSVLYKDLEGKNRVIKIY